MDFLRRLIALSLVLSLLATSAAMAVARGQSDMGSLMVICTGQAYTVMEIGADGTPVERAHICPDCTLSLFVAVNAPAIQPRPQVLARILSATAPAQTDARTPFLRTHARGPPTLV
jgi:glycerol uptake facilitator-like aquaporin